MVDRFVRVSDTVETLPDAWSFVMAHLDTIGSHPSIAITPVWFVEADEDGEPVAESNPHYEVSVAATVSEGDE